jgi:hypothetical protein
MGTRANLKAARTRFESNNTVKQLRALQTKIAELDKFDISGQSRKFRDIELNKKTTFNPFDNKVNRVTDKFTTIEYNPLINLRDSKGNIIGKVDNLDRAGRKTKAPAFNPHDSSASFLPPLLKQAMQRREAEENAAFDQRNANPIDIEVEQIGGLNFEKGFSKNLTDTEFQLLDSHRFSEQANAGFGFLSDEAALLSPDIRNNDKDFKEDFLALERARFDRARRKAEKKSFGSVVSGLTGGDPAGKAQSKVARALARLESIHGAVGRGAEIESLRKERLSELDPEFSSRASEGSARRTNELLINKKRKGTGIQTPTGTGSGLATSAGINIPT